MLRKPQPKEAAQAVRQLLLANGIEVGKSLTLEIVAKVEGYDDWNTFVAANPANRRRPAKNTSKPKGPFRVVQNGKRKGTYALLEEARQSASKLLAPQTHESNAGFNDVDILAADDTLIARAIHPASRYRVYVDDKLYSQFWAEDEFLDSMVNYRQDYGNRRVRGELFDLPAGLDVPGYVRTLEPTLILDHESLTDKMQWNCAWESPDGHRWWAIPKEGFSDDLGVALDEVIQTLVAAGYPAPSRIWPDRVDNGSGHEVYSLDHWQLEIPGHPEMHVTLTAQYFAD